jgi:hypothetical protein
MGMKSPDALCKMRRILLPWQNSWRERSGRPLPKKWSRHSSRQILAEVSLMPAKSVVVHKQQSCAHISCAHHIRFPSSTDTNMLQIMLQPGCAIAWVYVAALFLRNVVLKCGQLTRLGTSSLYVACNTAVVLSSALCSVFQDGGEHGHHRHQRPRRRRPVHGQRPGPGRLLPHLRRPGRPGLQGRRLEHRQRLFLQNHLRPAGGPRAGHGPRGRQSHSSIPMTDASR